MRSRFVTVVALGSMLAFSGACATKGYVQKQVASVDEKVESMSKALEDTQQRTRANEQRIEAVNKTAESAGSTAQTAQNAANAANKAAGAADARAAAVEAQQRKLVYEVTLSEDQGNFRVGSAVLPDAAKERINQLINQLKSDPKSAYLEIEGHTDNTGDKAFNQQLGLQRAEAVKNYLHDTFQIPLFKISVISYGEDKPVAPNNTRAGRAQNRRVVIRILT